MKMKSILFSLIVFAMLIVTSCGGKKAPIIEQCPACNGEKICQICQGTSNCSSCNGEGQCDVCKGDKKCKMCKGSGQVRAKCSTCKGYGFAPPKNPGDEPVPCKKCKATGLAPKSKKAPCTQCVVQTDAFKKKVEAGKIDLKKFKNDVKGSNFPAIEKTLKGIKKGTGLCKACEGSALCQTCKGEKKCTICTGTGNCISCEGKGHKIDFVKCPKCYEEMKYGETKCTKCQTEVSYEEIGK